MRLFILSTIGQRVTDARKAKGLSQKELAELIGTTQQTITNIETKSPDSRYYLKISEVLDVSYEWIVKGEKKAPGLNSTDDIESYIAMAEDAFMQAINSYKAISLQRGDNIASVDFELMNDAFMIALRGKITGDYVTASLNARDLKRKA
jgi:transcriptional regulator with XRE-family HTH domain